MPDDLKALKDRLARLTAEEEAAWAARDYERAATFKVDRIKLEQDFELARTAWRSEKGLDEVVSAEDIAQLVASWTGIPVASLMEEEAQKLLRMEDELGRRIIGQHEAIAVLSDALRRARSGLKDPRRPIGSFIFLGTSGVGKTELAKALAEFLFEDEDALLRIDMSEYRERHTVSRLMGAPPGYVGYDEGGQLSEAVRRRPYRVILFDEIEKAHPEVWNTLLQIMEDGRLTDGQGHLVDFRNCVIIMTSNIGTAYAKQGGALGFRSGGEDQSLDAEDRKLRDKIERGLRDTFRPEFLNRIDEIIIFHTLTKDDVRQIVDLQMKEISERLDAQGLAIALTEPARDWLVDKGYDPQFGARPLRRTLQRHIESPLSKRLLRGEFHPGDSVLVTVAEDQENPDQTILDFERQPEEPIAVDLPFVANATSKT
jgi:ATP-dependent Clp protease ATP-binding subunit ClpC